jgi:hypothetical protein
MNDSSENSAVDNSCRSWHHIADTVPAGKGRSRIYRQQADI